MLPGCPGFADTDDFGDALTRPVQAGRNPLRRLFEKFRRADRGQPRTLSSLTRDDPATLAGLERLGFSNPPAAIAAMRAWQSGRYAATRSERARERLTEFLPALLDAFGQSAEPDLALATFDRVMAEMPAGVQLFSLLAANPSLLRLIADIMGTAPRLARILAPAAAPARCRARSWLLRHGADCGQA